MQDWKIVKSSKYSLICCTYVFHRCRFVLAFSVLAFSVASYRAINHHDQSHCESSPGSFDECRLSAGWSLTLRPSQLTWAVSPPKIGSYRSTSNLFIYPSSRVVSMSECSVTGPRFESHRGRDSCCDMQPWARLRTFTAVSRSTHPSTFRMGR